MSAFTIPIPLGQWCFALGAVLVGFAFGCGWHIRNNRLRTILYLVITLLTLVSCFGLHILGFSHLVVPYSLAVILVCGAHLWHGCCEHFPWFMDSMTFGIYLVHPLVSSSTNIVCKMDQMPWIDIGLTFIISLIVVYAMKTTFLRRFV
jgi:hypothetical protein